MFRGVGGGLTVIVNVALVLLPQESLAVFVTVVVPIGKMLPLGGCATTVGELQPPVAVEVKETAVPLELVAVIVMFDEDVRTIGG